MMRLASGDFASSFVFLVAIVTLSLCYGVRLFLKGQAHFDRVDRQGGSTLLSKGWMEMGYWSLQPLSRFLIFCHITPHQLSWTSLFFGSLAGLVLAFGHFGFGACFSTISAMLDILDGMVARTLGCDSDAGEVLDASVDRYVEFFFFMGLAVYYHSIPTFLVLVLFALVGSFMVSYSTAKAEALDLTPPRGSMRRPERTLYLVLGAALSPLSISWLERDRNASIAIAHPMIIMLCMVAVLANFSALERLYTIAQRAKEKKEALNQEHPRETSRHPS